MGYRISGTIKPGTVFEHRHWLDYKNMPLLCVVTAVRHGVIHWREWGHQGKSKHYFHVTEVDKYINNILETA